MTFFMVFVYYLGPVFHWIVAMIFPSYVVGDVDVEANIDNYWAALDDEDRHWSIMEESNSRSLL